MRKYLVCVQAQSAILRKDAVPLMVRWLDAGPEQEVATAAARALAKAAKGNKAVQQAICDAGTLQLLCYFWCTDLWAILCKFLDVKSYWVPAL